MNKFYSIDLFAGAGGLSLGLEQAGFTVVLANELEKDFSETYRFNHKNTLMINDDVKNLSFKEELRKMNFSGKIHLVCGGPPCQGFSTVGKKLESDSRNSLFKEFIRAVEELEPDFVLFENVSGFKKLYSGKIFSLLLEEFKRLNYQVKYRILNALHFGLPQSRERTIVVGYKRRFSFDMPEGEYSNGDFLFHGKEYRTLRDAISDLPSVGIGESSNDYAAPPLNDYQKTIRGDCARLTEHVSPTHGEKLLNMISTIPYGGSVLDMPMELRPKGYFKNTYARLVWEKPAPTITRNFGTPSSSRCIHPTLNRGLTTREGARLQGFPDDYVFFGSRSSKNLQIGNAVPPIFGYEIGKRIYKSLLEFYK